MKLPTPVVNSWLMSVAVCWLPVSATVWLCVAFAAEATMRSTSVHLNRFYAFARDPRVIDFYSGV